jgi:hypothetical protein
MQAEKKPHSKRIDEVDIRRILRELDLWQNGVRVGELTWSVLERFSGFSRQALHARPEIKAAYQAAKISLRGGLAKARIEAVDSNESLQAELARLKAQLAIYEEREAKWRARWQRIAYHLRAKGFQVSHIDRPIPIGVKGISTRDADNVLRPFDKEIPPTGKS